MWVHWGGRGRRPPRPAGGGRGGGGGRRGGAGGPARPWRFRPRHANGLPATALRVFALGEQRHPAALLSADWVLHHAACLQAAAAASGAAGAGTAGGAGALRDCRSLFERALAAMAAAARAAAGCLGAGGADEDTAAASKEWRGAVPPPGPAPLWLAYMRLEVRVSPSLSLGAVRGAGSTMATET
jgi:hypothetical protein